jgi:hypothetical protein
MNIFSSKRAFVGLLFFALFWASGCSPIKKEEACGQYSRAILGVIDTIAIKLDGSFSQYITFTNGQAWSTTGRWNIVNQNIHLHTCYIAYDVEKRQLVIPPSITYDCAFGLVRGNLVRSEWEPPWIRNTKTSGKDGVLSQQLTNAP